MIAMFEALSTITVHMWVAFDQLATLRLHTSITTARYSTPAQIAM